MAPSASTTASRGLGSRGRPGMRGRADAAQQNSFEAFPFFAAGRRRRGAAARPRLDHRCVRRSCSSSRAARTSRSTWRIGRRQRSLALRGRIRELRRACSCSPPPARCDDAPRRARGAPMQPRRPLGVLPAADPATLATWIGACRARRPGRLPTAVRRDGAETVRDRFAYLARGKPSGGCLAGQFRQRLERGGQLQRVVVGTDDVDGHDRPQPVRSTTSGAPTGARSSSTTTSRRCSSPTDPTPAALGGPAAGRRGAAGLPAATRRRPAPGDRRRVLPRADPFGARGHVADSDRHRQDVDPPPSREDAPVSRRHRRLTGTPSWTSGATRCCARCSPPSTRSGRCRCPARRRFERWLRHSTGCVPSDVRMERAARAADRRRSRRGRLRSVSGMPSRPRLPGFAARRAPAAPTGWWERLALWRGLAVAFAVVAVVALGLAVRPVPVVERTIVRVEPQPVPSEPKVAQAPSKVVEVDALPVAVATLIYREEGWRPRSRWSCSRRAATR